MKRSVLVLLSAVLISGTQLAGTVECVAKSKKAAPAAAATAPAAADTKTAAAPDAKASAADTKKKDLQLKIDSISSPIKAGSDATASVTTSPNAICDITVKYKSGPASAGGLKSQRADKDGKCTWTWKVAKNTAAGEWPVEIKASQNRAKATANGTIKVEK